MKVRFPRFVLPFGPVQVVSLFVAMILLATPLCAQQPAATPAKPASQPQSVAPTLNPTFETLLSVDSYKLYGEVRNVGQLMSNGGLGEIVDPIIKLAEPPKEFNSIIKFLKANAEALASSRLSLPLSSRHFCREFFRPCRSPHPKKSPPPKPRQPKEHSRLRPETRKKKQALRQFRHRSNVRRLCCRMQAIWFSSATRPSNLRSFVPHRVNR